MVNALIVYACSSRDLLYSVLRFFILVFIHHICVATLAFIDLAIQFLHWSPDGLILTIFEKKITIRYCSRYSIYILIEALIMMLLPILRRQDR